MVRRFAVRVEHDWILEFDRRLVEGTFILSSFQPSNCRLMRCAIAVDSLEVLSILVITGWN